MNNKKSPVFTFRQLIKPLFKIIPFIFIFVFKGLDNVYKKLLKRFRFSITFKITIVYAGMFTRILILLSLGICISFIAYLGINAENVMLKDYKLISSYIKESIDFPENSIEQIAKLDVVSITIFDEDHKVIYTTQENKSNPIFYDKHNSKDISNSKGNYMLVTNENALTPGGIFTLILNNKTEWGSKTIYIQITNELSKELVSFIALVLILFAINTFFILITILVGSRASKRMLLPIEAMTKTVKNITINALDTRLNVSGAKDELKELAETFNNMLDRIQESYEQQNQFVSDASHELRTPISVIQGYVNLLNRWGKNDKEVLEEAICAIKAESESMKDLIENLLFLARGDKNTQKIEMTKFYLDELIDEIVKETKLIDSTHEILSERNEKNSITADRNLLKEALRIFIDNSVKYTLEGGKISISSFSQKNQLIITIEDTGIGIPKEDLPNIFNRFYRTDKSRTKETGGTGLGLAIAKWIILKHKGTIEVESKVNFGTKISLFLPISF